MTVRELVDELLRLPPDTKVLAEGGCCGGQCASEVTGTEEVKEVRDKVWGHEGYALLRVRYE